jgi:hypothetical protein
MPGSVLENVLEVYLGASCELTQKRVVMQTWSAIAWNSEFTREHAWECAGQLLESWCGSVQSSRLGV